MSFHSNILPAFEQRVEAATGLAVAGVYGGRRAGPVPHMAGEALIRRGAVESTSESGHEDFWVQPYEIELRVYDLAGGDQAGQSQQDELDRLMRAVAVDLDGTRALSDVRPEIVSVSAGEIVPDEDPEEGGRVVGVVSVEFLVNGSGFPGAPSAAQSTVDVSAATAAPDGVASVTITVTVLDAAGDPVPGAPVVLSSSGTGDTITQPAALTNASGVATGSIVSTVAEVKTISATASGVSITDTAAVTYLLDPASILGAKLAAWFDPSDAATVTSDGDGVSALADKVSGNPAAVQADNAKKPNVSAAAINGLDAILYDYVSQEHLSCAAPVTAAPFRIFAIVQVSTYVGIGSPVFVGLSSAGSSDRWQFQTGGGSQRLDFIAFDSGGNAFATTLAALTVGQTHLVEAHEIGSSDHRAYLDGESEAVNDYQDRTPVGVDTLAIGGIHVTGTLSGLMAGLIGEVVVVDESAGAITAQQLADLETYFERWGITIP